MRKKTINGLSSLCLFFIMTHAQADARKFDLSPSQAKITIEHTANQVLLALKNRNMLELAKFIHPHLGVRFTYNTHISKKNKVFSPYEIAHALSSNKIYTWGYSDGSDKPVRFTFKQYLSKVVYNHNYTNPQKIGYNQTLHSSNMIDNSEKFYPHAIMVQYYFPGFKKKYGGMDWASLRLFFELYHNKWYLAGVVNDRWAI